MARHKRRPQQPRETIEEEQMAAAKKQAAPESTQQAQTPPAPSSAAAVPGAEIGGLFGSPPIAALAIFVLVGLALALLRAGASMLSPLILAFIMVTISLPVYGWLQKRGVGKGLAIVLLALGIMVVGLLLALLAWLSVQRLISGLNNHLEAIETSTRALITSTGIGNAEGTSRAIAQLFATLAGTIVSVVTQFSISAILAAFLIIEAPRFGRLLNTSMKNLPFLGMTPQVMQAAVAYILVRLRLNLLTGLAFGLFLWIIGVDYALLWGIITVFLSFVPYVGLVLAAIPPVVLALAERGWVWALVVIVAVTAINFTVENVLAPQMTGKTLSLSPAVVFVAFLFWIWILGPVGALTAMPLTVLLMLTFEKYESTRWVAELIGAPPS
jgi:predicted PurR-regulated permease PerM